MEIRSNAPGLSTPMLDRLRPAQRTQGASFTSALDGALRQVAATQAEASRMAEDFQRDPGRVSLEETMVAMQKSQIGFQSALHVRNRLVSAYTDIMNMPV